MIYLYTLINSCDEGYTGDMCHLESVTLPTLFRDTFDISSGLPSDQSTPNNWLSSYGSSISTICGIVVSDEAMMFYKVLL